MGLTNFFERRIQVRQLIISINSQVKSKIDASPKTEIQDPPEPKSSTSIFSRESFSSTSTPLDEPKYRIHNSMWEVFPLQNCKQFNWGTMQSFYSEQWRTYHNDPWYGQYRNQ